MVRPLAWDTEFWGVRAARVIARSPGELEDAECACRELGIQWASLLVPIDELMLINAATHRGWDVVDVRYTMTMALGERSPSTNEALARVDDVDGLAHIARESLVDGRFYADSHLDDQRCADFYETWLRNSFNGSMADAVVVASGETSLDGFITVRVHSDGSATLPLVAVRHDRQGQGVGRRLLSTTLDWIASQGGASVEVVTQLANTAAIALYASGGFRLTSSAVWLHRWYDASESSSGPT
jgi:dTDP-4-amino-4,6-dideoxy-D-galactose acyltransferase